MDKRKIMKKILPLTLVLFVLFSVLLSGCGRTEEPSGSSSETSEPVKYEWPTQPVNVMCPAAAGGGTDMMLRVLNEYFTKKTGQPFVITNVSGVSGYEQTYQAVPDGYNFIAGTTTIFVSELDGTFDYDWDDYEMVLFVEGNYSTCIAVRADSPYQTINDLFDAAKADPTSITGGITLSGQPYMFAKALKDAVGIDLYYVDTGNTSERNAALLGGQVDYIITNVMSVQGYVDSGDFRLIAIDGEERFELAPDVPTFKEQGVDFCFVPQPIVWLAPPNTPKDACEAFNAILAEMYTDPDVRAEFRDKLNNILHEEIPSIEESKVMAQKFKDTLAPYVE